MPGVVTTKRSHGGLRRHALFVGSGRCSSRAGRDRCKHSPLTTWQPLASVVSVVVVDGQVFPDEAGSPVGVEDVGGEPVRLGDVDACLVEDFADDGGPFRARVAARNVEG